MRGTSHDRVEIPIFPAEKWAIKNNRHSVLLTIISVSNNILRHRLIVAHPQQLYCWFRGLQKGQRDRCVGSTCDEQTYG